ncbi:MAG: DUF4388 domain-containing protein [Thermoanaerobaculia bacterium]
MEFSGRLASFPIGDILQWAHNDRRSGALVVRRSGSEKRIFLHDGDVVACFSDDPAEFFGQHLLVNGLLEEPALIRALKQCQSSGQRLGDALQTLGLLPVARVQEELQQHVENQVCDIFLWRSGIFYFAAESIDAALELTTPLSAVALAMEGSRWADEAQRIRRIFVHENVVLQRGRKAPQGLLSPLERRIYRVLDGRLTLGELYNEIRGSYYRFLEAAYRLTVVEALDIESVGDHSDSGSTELRLADLLIEQVTEEQAVFLRRNLALPFDAIEHSVPVWVKPPSEAEEARMAQPVREFYRRIDGATEIGALLSAASIDERTRRLDWLIVKLREGALALLPMTLQALEGADGSTAAESAPWWKRLAPQRR